MTEIKSTPESSGKVAYKAFMGVRIVLKQIHKEEDGLSINDMYCLLLGLETAKLELMEDARKHDDFPIDEILKEAIKKAPLLLKDLQEYIKNED